MGDRYIVENEFDHDGYKCVVIFNASQGVEVVIALV